MRLLAVDLYVTGASIIGSISGEAAMPALDAGAPGEERSSERMNFRTKPHIKRAIQRAAALQGVADSAFTLNAASRAALDTIPVHERTFLWPEVPEAFFR